MNIATLKVSNAILALISELDEFKGAWQAIGRIAPERLSNLRHVATIESIGSSTRIEGAKLSDREVEALLSNLDSLSFANRDEEEVAGYASVMETVFENARDIPLTVNYIKQLHGQLLQHSQKDVRHRGEYKTLSSSVEAFTPEGESVGVIFQTATPFDTPRLMNELIEWTNTAFEEKSLHPLLVIAVFTVVFLEIHPFQDGNGRLSRVLTTLLLLQAGYAYVPYSSLESVIEANKEGYYLALRQTQGTIRTETPNWQPWVTYFLQSLVKQKQKLDAKIKRERILLGDLPELSVQILEVAREHGRVTVNDAEKATGANRNTIKDHIKSLVKNGHLERHGAGRGTWYSLS
ncbi:MAG: AsnC family transcriptional regulator [Halioglobus sp.]|nr:AsnC family transcriptional regulator [Halioglobus sp.]|tara:strand:+ start:257 stop:1303 length:1047 start_codon:yes stop_codon:yes gene_type:complete